MNHELFINTADKPVQLDQNSIFLAGPTHRSLPFVQSWRNAAIQILTSLNYHGVVYVPEFMSEISFSDELIDRQIHWEWEALDVAGMIVFWVPRERKELPGFSTNVEFGRYVTLKPDKVLLGYPQDACDMEYLRLLYLEVTKRCPCQTLSALLAEAVTHLQNQ